MGDEYRVGSVTIRRVSDHNSVYVELEVGGGSIKLSLAHAGELGKEMHRLAKPVAADYGVRGSIGSGKWVAVGDEHRMGSVIVSRVIYEGVYEGVYVELEVGGRFVELSLSDARELAHRMLSLS